MADAWQTYPFEFRGGLITNLAPTQQGVQARSQHVFCVTLNLPSLVGIGGLKGLPSLTRHYYLILAQFAL